MYTLIKRTDAPKSEVQLEVSIPYSEVEREWQAALTEVKQGVELPGFRPGMAPDNLIIDRVGDGMILEKASQRALNRILPKIMEEEKIDIIAAPDVVVTKLEKGQDLEFTAKVVVMPNITLGDYKKIAKEIREKKSGTDITDDDVMKYIDALRKQRAVAAKRATREQLGVTENTGEEIEVSESDLPALDDAFVKSLGAFSNVDDFMEKVRAHLEEDKVVRAREQLRVDILQKIIDESTIEVPDLLIEQELDKMMAQFEADIKAMGVSIDEYFANIKKSAEDIRNEWRTEAEKRAKANIVLPEIASREKIIPDPLLVDQETQHVMNHIKDAEPRRARLYVFSILLNEAVFDFLEGREQRKAVDGGHSHEHHDHGHTHNHDEEGHVHDENCKHD